MWCESPPLLLTQYRAGIASIREELMAGSWDLHAQQSRVWSRALTGRSSSPMAAVARATRERAVRDPLEYFYLLLNIVLAGKRSSLQLASHCRTAGFLQLLGSSSLEVAVLEQQLDSCNGQSFSGTEQEVTYGFRKGRALLSVAGLRSSLEFVRGEILK